MIVLITCKSDEDSIKIKIAVVRTFSEVYGTQGRVTLMPVCRNWAKIEFIPDLMHVFVIYKFDEDPIRNEVSISQTFPNYMSMGAWKGR